MPKNYNSQSWMDSGGLNSPINGGSGGIFSVLDDFLGSLLFGDPDSSSKLWNDLSGATAQQKEFEQQEYLLDKQNEYNLPSNQMYRMMSAGINPNTAAAGIAGVGSQSAQPSAVSNNTSGAANALNAITSGVASLAAAHKDIAEADNISTLTPYQQDQLYTESVKNWEDAGLSHWGAVQTARSLPGILANQQADFFLKLANYDKVMAEYDNLKALHDNIIAEYDNILATHELTMSQKEYFDALKGKIDEESRWQKQQNDFFEINKYYPDSDLGVSFRNATVAGLNADQIGKIVQDYQEKVRKGFVSAEKELQSHIAEVNKDAELAVQSGKYSAEEVLLAKRIYLEILKEWETPDSNAWRGLQKGFGISFSEVLENVLKAKDLSPNVDE